MLNVFDAATGTPHYVQQRLPKPYNFKASPLVVGDRVYLATEEGDVVVVKAGDSFEVLATNTLTDQSFIASPIVVGDLAAKPHAPVRDPLTQTTQTNTDNTAQLRSAARSAAR